jgi:hypothetical protein
VFDSQEDAGRAVADLRDHGFGEGDISVVTPDFSQRPATTDVATSQPTHLMAAGSLLFGGLALAGWGAVFALWFYYAFWLAVIVGGLAAALALVVLAGAVVEFARAGREGRRMAVAADRFEPEVAAGRTVVTVRADRRAAEAASVLRGHGGRDGSERFARPPAA